MHLVSAGVAAVAGVCAGAAFFAWRRRDRPGSRALTALLAALALWNAAYAFELASVSLDAKLWSAKVQYLGITAVPLAVLYFALHYRVGGTAGGGTERNHRWFPLLVVVPALVVAAVWTNEAHGLIWREVTLATRGPFPVLSVTYGPGFVVWWAYAYALLFTAAILLVSGFLHLRRSYRRQFAMVVAVVVVPWIGNAFYVLDVVEGLGLDFTNIGFAFSGLILTVGALRGGLLDVMPITRSFVVERMDDAMVLADVRDRVVDCNRAAQPLLTCPVAQATGRPAVDVVRGWGKVPATPGTSIVEIGDPPARRSYEAKVTLVPTVGGSSGRLVLFHDVTAREQLQAHLRERALTDALTGLPNRRLLLDRADHALAKAGRTGEIIAMLYCDLDDFKMINDVYGHDSGDEVLLTVAHRLQSGIRSGDTVARLGGDEFAVLLENLAGPTDAEEVGQRLADRLAEPIALGGRMVTTPASIGIAVARGGGSTTRDLLRDADRAMYTVKRDPGRRTAVARSGSGPPPDRSPTSREASERPQ